MTWRNPYNRNMDEESRGYRSDEKDEYLLIKSAETPNAWGVRQTEDGKLIWLPKSKVETDERDMRQHRTGLEDPIWSFHIPEWLATKEGIA